jgi:hypothetical protein
MSSGLHFCNIDLHIHTPISECFSEKGITPEKIVEQAIKAGMKAIAITDHNSGDWVDIVKEAAIGKELVIFPGVEITVQPGVHILAIFPEDKTTANITDLLTELGLLAKDRGKNTSAVTKYGISEVVSIIISHEALPILAHIDSESGVWNELGKTGASFISFWNDSKYAAVEIIGERLPEAIGKDPLKRIPAFFWSSDNPNPQNPTKHSHLGIGIRYSQFKVDEPITWEGLRLCFQDPSTRIKPADHQSYSHPTIDSVFIEGGFLNDINIKLSPNLNCFIGGRGTGKSCFLEIIRHAFNIDPKTDQNKLQANGIVKNTFQAGSKISINMSLDSKSKYKLERASGDAPKIFRFGESNSLDIQPKDLLPIQVYGQKEVYEISRDVTFQLRLFDNYIGEVLNPLQKEENQLINTLRDNSNQIEIITKEIEDIRGDVSNLGSISEQLHRMETLDFTSKLERKSSFDQEKEFLELVRSKQNEQKLYLESIISTNNENWDEFQKIAIEDSANSILLEKQKTTIEEIYQLFDNSLQLILNQIDVIQNRNKDGIEAWENAFDHQEEAYQALLREYQLNSSELKPERYIFLQTEQRRLQGLAQKLTEKSKDYQGIISTRTNLLLELRKNRRKQYEVRQAKAADLTSALGKKVRITIWPQGNREEYLKQLDTLFEGTRTRKEVLTQIAYKKTAEPERAGQRPISNQGNIQFVIPEIPQFFDQIDLDAAILKEGNTSTEEESDLHNLFEVNSDAMRDCISSLPPEKILDLEIFSIPDLPIIELQVSSGELGYKPLNSLSIGQKCTALLSLVLLESSAPLLIDQPEDDLDNHFIFDQIVSTLRNAKEKRQFLIATHNANIPVSGDAELIVVLNANESHGWIEPDGIGSIDSQNIKQYVEHILEGGKDAFIIRKEKYGI